MCKNVFTTPYCIHSRLKIEKRGERVSICNKNTLAISCFLLNWPNLQEIPFQVQMLELWSRGLLLKQQVCRAAPINDPQTTEDGDISAKCVRELKPPRFEMKFCFNVPPRRKPLRYFIPWSLILNTKSIQTWWKLSISVSPSYSSVTLYKKGSFQLSYLELEKIILTGIHYVTNLRRKGDDSDEREGQMDQGVWAGSGVIKKRNYILYVAAAEPFSFSALAAV